MKKTTISFVLLCCSFTLIACNLHLSRGQNREVESANRNTPSTETSPKEREGSGRVWRSAIYHELRVGESTQADMLRVLGQPESSGPAAGQMESAKKPIIWNEYRKGGEFPGKLTVEIDKSSNVIVGMVLSPDNLSKVEAIKYFGDDYVITKYKRDKCSEGEEAAPLFESSDGQFIYIEYRQRGIAIFADDTDKVKEISYVSDKQPIGAPSSRCL